MEEIISILDKYESQVLNNENHHSHTELLEFKREREHRKQILNGALNRFDSAFAPVLDVIENRGYLVKVMRDYGDHSYHSSLTIELDRCKNEEDKVKRSTAKIWLHGIDHMGKIRIDYKKSGHDEPYKGVHEPDSMDEAWCGEKIKEILMHIYS